MPTEPATTQPAIAEQAIAEPGAARRQHAYTGPAMPQLPEPSHAERARTLLSLSTVAVLSTVSRRHEGFPFGSLMPFALDKDGRPIFLISNMAMHTQNLRAQSRASLFVAQDVAGADPLGAARVTLLGHVQPVLDPELPAVRELYLERHANSSYWVDFADFHFFRLQPLEAYYVGGFGVMGWVDATEYAIAAPDPLAASASGILTHMNADHVDSMVLLACRYARIDASEAAMTAVDRLGFSLRLKTAEGMKGTRINFLRPVSSSQETRAALIELVREAKSAAAETSRS